MGEHQQNQNQGDLQKQVAELSKRLSAVETENKALKSAVQSDGIRQDVPVYEVAGAGYYSPDDCFYPAGARFEDLSGGYIIPNEEMIPLNKMAEDRLTAYLARRPSETPPLDLIIQASMELRPKEGEPTDPEMYADWYSRVVKRAIELKYRQEGLLPGDAPKPRQVKMPSRNDNVPMMSNTKIGGVGGGVTSAIKNRLTNEVRGPIDPANKTAPALGTIQSQPVGTRG